MVTSRGVEAQQMELMPMKAAPQMLRLELEPALELELAHQQQHQQGGVLPQQHLLTPDLMKLIEVEDLMPQAPATLLRLHCFAEQHHVKLQH
jgi:hypothetical protein